MLSSDCVIKNRTTWDTDELVAFVRTALEAVVPAGRPIETLDFSVFRVGPKRLKRLRERDQTIPTMFARTDYAKLRVKLPSPRLFKPKSALDALASTADNRLHMPGHVRNKLYAVIERALRRQFEDVEDVDVVYYDARPELPSITTSAVATRATPKKTLKDWKRLAHEAWQKRTRAEDRLAKLEETVERLRRREDKLDDKVRKLEAREERREEKRRAREQKRQDRETNNGPGA